jgi:hypothetical protein
MPDPFLPEPDALDDVRLKLLAALVWLLAAGDGRIDAVLARRAAIQLVTASIGHLDAVA